MRQGSSVFTHIGDGNESWGQLLLPCKISPELMASSFSCHALRFIAVQLDVFFNDPK